MGPSLLYLKLNKIKGPKMHSLFTSLHFTSLSLSLSLSQLTFVESYLVPRYRRLTFVESYTPYLRYRRLTFVESYTPYLRYRRRARKEEVDSGDQSFKVNAAR